MDALEDLEAEMRQASCEVKARVEEEDDISLHNPFFRQGARLRVSLGRSDQRFRDLCRRRAFPSPPAARMGTKCDYRKSQLRPE